MADQTGTAPGNVAAGVDGSADSVAAAHWAAEQAARTGARLELVTAWQYPTSWGTAIPLPDGFDPEADARALLDPVVDEVRAAHPGLEVHGRVVEGHPSEVLTEASRHAGLLVVGSRGHGAFTGMLLGSVSRHCVAHSSCPVVVYRAPEPPA